MEFVTKSLDEIATESTCQKRVTVCELYALIPGYETSGQEPKILIARESNRCSPPNGQCARLGISQGKAEYPAHSECKWEHAEIRALQANTSCLTPMHAIIYGHDFPCPDCEAALKHAGIEHIICRPRPSYCYAEIGLRAGKQLLGKGTPEGITTTENTD